MCGFVGFVSQKMYPSLIEQLEAANRTLSFRGPDDYGYFADEKSGLGLGHRRLSIIDLSSAGKQPLASRDNNFVIAYNGEIYNYIQLQNILKDKGYHFKSNTDTEVVLNAYIEWGQECLEKFNGMFSFAIWDKQQNKLFLARDRLGIKPLYYYYHRDVFIFGSELKALMAFKQFPRDIDIDSIPLFLHYQYIPSPKAIFLNTHKLRPGFSLAFQNGKITIDNYWKIPSPASVEENHPMDEYALVERLDQLLTQSVSDRLISDVPIGALLSGGIDSSLVCALMQKINTSPIKTFCVGFEDSRYNEAPWASKIANHLGTDHTELYVEPNQALDLIPLLPIIYDEPFADSSSIPSFIVSKLTRKNVTVALTGDGGDEQFGGYVRYWMTGSMAKRLDLFPSKFRSNLTYLAHRIPINWVENAYLSMRRFFPKKWQVGNVQDKWQKLLLLIEEEKIAEIYKKTVCFWDKKALSKLSSMALPQCLFDELFDMTHGWPVMQRLMYVDQHTYLPDCMLTKVDRASMANSLEIRVPLLDHRVVEFTSRLPVNLQQKNSEGKYLLKQVLAQYIPKKLIDRPKMGFGVPIAQWLRGPLKELMLDFLSSERLKTEGIFNQNVINSKIDEHLSGRHNHQHQLWAILMYQMWRSQWMN